ncbi:hypothetical protein [Rhodococcoides yunnanense]|uniref:hypothetical protein n=1 Tax=Rhodococcoides yunnanense TaxID=278209 RepID=UPI0022B0FE37|nr:hypothetical protein [Rhodococcus yunnanensis]MCZ4278923.1 hypothetical protein [Rhodococcus yunnanensis]
MGTEDRNRAPELTASEDARFQLMLSLDDSATTAGRAMDTEGLLLSVLRRGQVDLSRDHYLNSLHMPRDAGEYAVGLSRLLLRIPDGRGRWVSHRKGWYRLITDLDASLANVDPDYEVHQVKEKFGVLRFYFNPSTDNREVLRRMRELVKVVEIASAYTCEECGRNGTDVCLRKLPYIVQTLCDACDTTHPRRSIFE